MGFVGLAFRAAAQFARLCSPCDRAQYGRHLSKTKPKQGFITPPLSFKLDERPYTQNRQNTATSVQCRMESHRHISQGVGLPASTSTHLPRSQSARPGLRRVVRLTACQPAHRLLCRSKRGSATGGRVASPWTWAQTNAADLHGMPKPQANGQPSKESHAQGAQLFGGLEASLPAQGTEALSLPPGARRKDEAQDEALPGSQGN